MNIVGVFQQLGPVAIIIILILTCLSIISWAIILEKAYRLMRANRESRRFLYLFDLYSDWRDIEEETKSYRHSPYVKVFKKALTYAQSSGIVKTATDRARTEIGPKEIVPSQITDLKQYLENSIATEIMETEKHLIFLSSTVSASPFLGLFGTVWGVMEAFMSISARGSAAMSVIGAGIAEALITTIVGLAVAIPVLFAYNLIVDKIQKNQAALLNFAPNILKKLQITKQYGA